VSVRRSATGAVDVADQLGKELAAQLLEEGVASLMPRPATPTNRAASPDPMDLREGDT
jgi:hypothetical protein